MTFNDEESAKANVRAHTQKDESIHSSIILFEINTKKKETIELMIVSLNSVTK
jgi:hypothetical protein